MHAHKPIETKESNLGSSSALIVSKQTNIPTTGIPVKMSKPKPVRKVKGAYFSTLTS